MVEFLNRGFRHLVASVGPTVFLCPQRLQRYAERQRGALEVGFRLDFWQVLPVAFALVLIIEGLLPFISPGTWRAMLAAVDGLDDNVIRGVGFGSMLIGVTLLYWIN